MRRNFARQLGTSIADLDPLGKPLRDPTLVFFATECDRESFGVDGQGADLVLLVGGVHGGEHRLAPDEPLRNNGRQRGHDPGQAVGKLRAREHVELTKLVGEETRYATGFPSSMTMGSRCLGLSLSGAQ